MRYLLDLRGGDTPQMIRNLFGFGKVTLRSKTRLVSFLGSAPQEVGVYRYTATGLKSMNDVISYFKEFPLFTKKARSFDK